ncbi:hypothetical protein PUN28_019651 [Cardiocondyla obscurior]|uniref:Uncharacterized protein n=1 Tax=Cardiocondyla obscurior TaxID=286306 RepID=A0AAW2EDX3_9HYME
MTRGPSKREVRLAPAGALSGHSARYYSPSSLRHSSSSGAISFLKRRVLSLSPSILSFLSVPLGQAPAFIPPWTSPVPGDPSAPASVNQHGGESGPCLPSSPPPLARRGNARQKGASRGIRVLRA